MRSRSLRFVASTLALGMAALSLGACTKDKGSDSTTAAAEAVTTTATAETLPIAPASSDTTVAAAAAGDTTVAPTTTAAAAAATSATDTSLAPNHNIVYTAVGAGSFLTLAKLLANADLITTMTGPGPFTVFAPTDAAFAAVPADMLNTLLADKALLTQVLTYHVMAGTTMSGELKTDSATLEKSTIKVTTDALTGKMMINDANIIVPDIAASNGVIHVIDKVLLPPDCCK